jgi:hypothetical protein
MSSFATRGEEETCEKQVRASSSFPAMRQHPEGPLYHRADLYRHDPLTTVVPRLNTVHNSTCGLYVHSSMMKTKSKLRGLSPPANYTH